MHSKRSMELHFWMHTAGLILYVAAMWTAGVTEGLMWRATDAIGALIHPFIDSLIAIRPFYLIRFLGGLLIVGGMIVMAWNLWHTAADARARLIKPIPVPIPEPEPLQMPAPVPARA
jgi:cytochrome c oxidase cbb3-type subunit 1